MYPDDTTRTDASPALVVSGVTMSYGGAPVLRDVNLTVPPRTIVALLGPNGAGKSSLISLLVGLRTPSSGSVSVCGVDPAVDAYGARAGLGWASQDLAVYPTLSARENLRFFGELRRMPADDIAHQVDEVLAALDLQDLSAVPLARLSGGQRRRVHVGAAMVGYPSLLVLDEPTTGVDVEAREHLLALVRARAAAGAGVLYSTHILDEVELLDATVMMLDRGHVIAQGDVEELVTAYGVGMLEVSLVDPLGPVSVPGVEMVDELTCCYRTSDPAGAIATITHAIGGERIASVRIVRPSLLSAFLAIAGRRTFEQGAEGPA